MLEPPGSCSRRHHRRLQEPTRGVHGLVLWPGRFAGKLATEYDVRYFRDARLMIVGEGTNEIQRNVIAAQLVDRGGLDA